MDTIHATSSAVASVRVAVVEVGSRAVRLLVADVFQGEVLKPIYTKSIETRLMGIVQNGVSETRTALEDIQRHIREFREESIRRGADRIGIFGTGAIRRISEMPEFHQSPYLSDIVVLGERDEAGYSFLAAAKNISFSRSSNSPLLVIDQGGGSLELATGNISPEIQMLDCESLALGGDELLRGFRSHSDGLRGFRDSLRRTIDQVRLQGRGCGAVVVQGSVATKCAWLTVRRDKAERYDPKRAHGKQLSAHNLEGLISVAEKTLPAQWATARAFFDPQNPTGDDFDRVVTGAVVLLLLLQRFNQEKFFVSAYGTRHGMALKLAMQR